MRRGGRIMMIFGLVLGIITAIATLFILRTSRPASGEEAAAAVPLQPVVVAYQPIEPYQPILADAIGIREWPADTLPPDVVTDTTTVAGKLSSTRVYPGQIILQSMLIDKELEEKRLGLGSDPAYIIPKGFVAVSLPIDDVSGVGGAIRDGDRADVMASFQLSKLSNIGPTGEEVVTQLVAQNVLVLKVGTWAPTTGDGSQTGRASVSVITLIVTPDEALRLKKAKDDGLSFDLALRPVNDEDVRELDPVGDQVILDELRFRTGPNQPLP
ncbi:MAG: Flp pilus assembly protein CpaB [Ardenticatenaceae bacterium]|nr:Flp pilus assembly protein CpaB [Ardenticatenaceae bacterium]HBY95172.1 Flp pilus assembly protein CpaB [Chloroflexota bacterium]